ncbi:Arc family DNA-binding protein [Andreprevotia sp. IGB-42]|uniref:Arc family DNA-binding protein n=1 Tax=Andreprevotia sp. IGB-42 TaxID=2497473 RepID=UPI00135B3765
MSREDPQYKLRVPPELREQIEHAAKINGRSMNAEVVARLQSTFNAGVVSTGQDSRCLEEISALRADLAALLGSPGLAKPR